MHQLARDRAGTTPRKQKERYAVFQRIWSAKEAVTKAVGEGIDFGMSRITVELDGVEPETLWDYLPSLGKPRQPAEPEKAPPVLSPRRARPVAVSIDGWARPEWEVWQQPLPGGHWVTVALGPTEEAVDANGEFIATLRAPGIHRKARQLTADMAEGPRFEILKVENLVPASQVEAYIAEARGMLIS
eukprot:gnl/TRDRNA2_/TRDRNA2_137477_c0_seq2.p2 gnl/TRDRNA2_/TRDRNA2_137477_c0~~gnl/TRDRNA2_/TRDRNA2_137477_c0_seq2.p2  ORF type:complete len:187 (+),score=34.14 gnl/TRDRNA2_/TRDRNA2_137477_c0_seq2:222-782(+)